MAEDTPLTCNRVRTRSSGFVAKAATANDNERGDEATSRRTGSEARGRQREGEVGGGAVAASVRRLEVLIGLPVDHRVGHKRRERYGVASCPLASNRRRGEGRIAPAQESLQTVGLPDSLHQLQHGGRVGRLRGLHFLLQNVLHVGVSRQLGAHLIRTIGVKTTPETSSALTAAKSVAPSEPCSASVEARTVSYVVRYTADPGADRSMTGLILSLSARCSGNRKDGHIPTVQASYPCSFQEISGCYTLRSVS